MNANLRSVLGTGTLCLILLLAGCAPPAPQPAPARAPTAMALPARPSSTALEPAAQPPPATQAAPPATASATPSPSLEPAPVEAAGGEACSNTAQLVADVTVPPNTILPSGQAFTKTWRVLNAGSCLWTTDYTLIRDSGEAMGGPAGVGLPLAVAGDSTVDISVQLVAPAAPGTYVGSWRLADGGGGRFGEPLAVQIVVPEPSGAEQLPETVTNIGAPTTVPVAQSQLAAGAGCDGTASDETEAPLRWSEPDKMHGEAVERLQRRLLGLGYKLPVYGADGWFGAETEAAVKEFQRRNGLGVDGYVGPVTWACLKNPNPARGD